MSHIFILKALDQLLSNTLAVMAAAHEETLQDRPAWFVDPAASQYPDDLLIAARHKCGPKWDD